MATWNRTTLANRCLETLGIKASGQGAAAEDLTTMGQVIDAVHSELQRQSLAPFATSAVPQWAQASLRQYLAARAVPEFSVPTSKAQLLLANEERYFRAYVGAQATQVPNVPTRVVDY